MVIKKYTYTDWMKGKNFVLSGLGMSSERNDAHVSELIKKSGGIISVRNFYTKSFNCPLVSETQSASVIVPRSESREILPAFSVLPSDFVR